MAKKKQAPFPTYLIDYSDGLPNGFAYNQLQARGAYDTLEGLLKATAKVFVAGEEKSRERLAMIAERDRLRDYLQIPKQQ